jgi:hypothetical protein
MEVFKEEALTPVIVTDTTRESDDDKVVHTLTKCVYPYRRYTHENVVSYIKMYVEEQRECFLKNMDRQDIKLIIKEMVTRLNYVIAKLNIFDINETLQVFNKCKFFDFIMDIENLKYWSVKTPSYSTRFMGHKNDFDSFIEESFMNAINNRTNISYLYFLIQENSYVTYKYAISFTFIDMSQFLITQGLPSVFFSIVSHFFAESLGLGKLNYKSHVMLIELVSWFYSESVHMPYLRYMLPDLYFATFINERERRRRVSVQHFCSLLYARHDFQLLFYISEFKERYAEDLTRRVHEIKCKCNVVMDFRENKHHVLVNILQTRFAKFIFKYLSKMLVSLNALHKVPALDRYISYIKFLAFEKSVRNIQVVYFNRNTGHEDFVTSGGESNPGPVFSRLSNYFDFKARLMSWVKSWFAKQYEEVLSPVLDFSVVSLHIVRIFTSVVDLLNVLLYDRLGLSINLVSRVSNLILNCHESWKVFGFTPIKKVTAEAGGAETLIATALLSAAMPPYMKRIMNDMPKLTSFKLLDDSSYVFELLAFVLSIPRLVLESFGNPSDTNSNPDSLFMQMHRVMCSVEDAMPFSAMNNVRYDMFSLCEEHRTKQSVLSELTYQTKFDRVNSKRKEIERKYLFQKKDLPKYYINVKIGFDVLEKLYLNYKNTSRVEPVCVVLCGPPGTGKSVFQSQLIDIYKRSGRTVFSDNIAASLDQKRFYDTYNDEDVYVVDDMGAKSKAQWSEIVNMVSTSKYPLEAAAISNKNMKSFNSELMILTTNHIPETFGQKDGIADKDAFLRRLVRYDFANATFDGKFHGTVEVKCYDSTRGDQCWRTIKTIPTCSLHQDFLEDIHLRQLEKMRVFEENRSLVDNIVAPPKLKLTRAEADDEVEEGMTLREVIFDRMREFPLFDTLFTTTVDAYQTVTEMAEKIMDPNVVDRKYLIFGALVVAAMGVGVYYACKSKKVSEEDDLFDGRNKPKFYSAHKGRAGRAKFVTTEGYFNLRGEAKVPIPSITKFARNLLDVSIHGVDLEGKDFTSRVKGLFSGRLLLTVAHPLATLDKSKTFFVTAKANANIVYDMIEVTIEKMNLENDWALLSLPKCLPAYYRKLNPVVKPRCYNLALITGTNEVLSLESKYSPIDYTMKYDYRQYKGELAPGDISYDFHGEGQCGSLLVTEDGCLLGMHVAMTEDEKGIEQGITKMWSREDLLFLKKCFELDDVKRYVEFVESKDVRSGVIRQAEPYIYSAEDTKYVKSPIYGIFPTWRKPALDLGSEHKDFKPVIDKMMLPTPVANIKGIEFCESMLKAEQATDHQFESLDEKELILGNSNLSRIDPKTSCGTMYGGKKKDYLDYENGKVMNSGKLIVREFADSIVKNEYNFGDYATLTLKDELKDVENMDDCENSMPKKVRVFTNYHIVSTLLFRFFFGNFMSFVFKHRNINGVMVGVNPMSKQWGKLAERICSLNEKVFDGDYSNFDRNMHPMFQRKLNKWLKGRVKIDSNKFNIIFGSNYDDKDVEKILDQILECIISTPIRGHDKSFITTHGLPSGLVLTSVYNSYMNKMYMTYCYYMNVPKQYQTVTCFNEHTKFAFYGDDILGNISVQLRPYFNPISINSSLEFLNLGFTPGDKNSKWTEETMFKSIDKVSFLKRKFYFNPKLKQVVAPLSTVSMEGSLNYVSDYRRENELTVDKLHGFQREAFLHPPEVYERYMYRIENFLEQKNLNVLNYKPLSEKALIELYETEEYSEFLILS